MTTSRTFQDLQVWQKAHRWVLDIYLLTKGFPREEMFGLTSQLRRAAVSVPANVAEGFAKRGRADKARFFNTAQGSLEECRYYLLLAQDLDYGTTEQLLASAAEISRMLSATSAPSCQIRRSFLCCWLLTPGFLLLTRVFPSPADSFPKPSTANSASLPRQLRRASPRRRRVPGHR